MATPTGARSGLYAVAFKKAATWGTAVALGAGNGILRRLGDSGLRRNQKYEPYPAVDQIMNQGGSLGQIDPSEITPPYDLQYEMGAWGTALAMFFGTAGAPTQQSGTAGYKHVFQWADAVSLFGTYAEERPGKIWEVPSAMPYKLNLKSSGSKIDAALTLRGNLAKDDSSTNGATQMDAVTYASRSGFVRFIEGKFLMNTQAGAGLADPTDKLDVSAFDVSLERPIDAVHVLGSDNIVLPVEDGAPKNQLKITLPRGTSANLAYMTNFTAGTTMKASLVFTGALISGAVYYVFGVYFPRLVFAGPPDAKLEGVIKNDLIFDIEEAAAAPTGMSYARPYLEVINLQTTDYLA